MNSAGRSPTARCNVIRRRSRSVLPAGRRTKNRIGSLREDHVKQGEHGNEQQTDERPNHLVQGVHLRPEPAELSLHLSAELADLSLHLSPEFSDLSLHLTQPGGNDSILERENSAPRWGRTGPISTSQGKQKSLLQNSESGMRWGQNAPAK